jgi:hypothetical protein
MLVAALIILGTAVSVGIVLAVLHLRTAGALTTAWPLAGLHGILALGGFGCLMLALWEPSQAPGTDTASFGTISAILIALAALVGSGLLAGHLLGRRLSGTLIGIHATLGVCGLVILSACIFAR